MKSTHGVENEDSSPMLNTKEEGCSAGSLQNASDSLYATVTDDTIQEATGLKMGIR